MNEFWSWFESEARPQLATFPRDNRSATFAEMFKYLDNLKRPVCIVETGCMRKLDWGGDGCSTLLFDKYVGVNGGQVYSVDIDPKATEFSRSLVNGRTTISTSDSIEFLKNLNQRPDLLYLDSYDYDATAQLSSQVHHINELNAAMHLIE